MLASDINNPLTWVRARAGNFCQDNTDLSLSKSGAERGMAEIASVGNCEMKDESMFFGTCVCESESLPSADKAGQT